MAWKGRFVTKREKISQVIIGATRALAASCADVLELQRVLRGKFCRVKAKCGIGGLQGDSPGLDALADSLPAKNFIVELILF